MPWFWYLCPWIGLHLYNVRGQWGRILQARLVGSQWQGKMGKKKWYTFCRLKYRKDTENVQFSTYLNSLGSMCMYLYNHIWILFHRCLWFLGSLYFESQSESQPTPFRPFPAWSAQLSRRAGRVIQNGWVSQTSRTTKGVFDLYLQYIQNDSFIEKKKAEHGRKIPFCPESAMHPKNSWHLRQKWRHTKYYCTSHPFFPTLSFAHLSVVGSPLVSLPIWII